jgi:5'-nucleotidase
VQLPTASDPRYARRVRQPQHAPHRPPLLLTHFAPTRTRSTLWDSVYKGAATAKVQNLLAPDAMVLGNHEFDFGVEPLAAYAKAVTFPILGACNMDVSTTPLLKDLVKKHTFITKGGVKVGVVGVITDETPIISSAPASLKFSDPVKALPGCIAALQAEDPSVRVIIVLSHVGYDLDRKIAAEVGGAGAGCG